MRKFTLLMLMVLILPLYAMADYNHALSFTTASTGATGDRLVVPLSALSTDDPYQGDATVSLWFRQEAMPSSGGVVLAYTTQSHDNDNGAVLLTSNTAGLKWVGWGQDQRLDAGTVKNATVSLNEWHNLTLVISNTDKWVKVYLDNELTIDRPFNEKTETFDLAETYDGEDDGAFTFGGFNFKGSYDEISFFNRALTAEEVAEAATAPESMAGLTAMYDFQEIVEGTSGQFANVAGNDNATVATYKTNRGGSWGSGVINITSESEAAANISYITEETARPKSQAVETHTLTINTNGQGAVTITDGTNTYASGEAIPATADLALTFAPAEGWTLASAVFAGGDFDGVDLVAYEMIEDGSYQLGNLTTDLTLNVTFEQAPVGTTYVEPNGSTAQSKAFIATASTSGAKHDISISRSSKADGFLGEVCEDDIIEVEQGSEFTLHLEANVASTNTTVSPNPQDLRYCVAFLFADWNGDGTFELVPAETATPASVNRYGVFESEFNSYNTDNKKTNYEWVLDINHKFVVPADAKLGQTRIRVIYTEAWDYTAAAADMIDGNYQEVNKGFWTDYLVNVTEGTPFVGTERLTVDIIGEGTVTVIDENGVEYDPAGADIPWDTKVKLFATPAAGWSVKSVEVGGEATQPAEDGSYLNMDLFMTCNVTVTFEENPKQMIYIYQPQNNGGKIEVFQGEKELQHQDYVAGGAELRAVATPNEGFEFSKFKHNNADVDASQVTVDEAGVATYTFNMSADAGLQIEAVFTETTGTVPPAEYCCPEGNATNANSRGVTTLVLTDSEDNTATVEGCGTSGSHKLYTDQTATVFTSAPGATVTLQVNGTGSWMMGYLYIDYNNNGTFDFDADKVDEYKMVAGQTSLTDGELVMHTGYTTKPNASKDDGIDDPTKSCDLTQFKSDVGFNGTLPTFTLPEDLKPGDYRVRYKVDWNCVDPCGRLRVNGYSKNFMDANGGLIIDFTLRIESQEPRAITVVSAQPELGSVAIIEPETAGNTVTVEGPVTIKATATDADAYFVNWTNAAGDVVSTEAEYTYGKGEEATFTANFRQHYLLTVVDAENGTTVKAGTTVVESGSYVDKGTELTVTCSVEEKILKSLMINEVEKVEEYVATGYVFTMNDATSIEVEYAMPVYEVGELAVEGEGTLVVAEGVTAEGAPSGATFAEGAELEKGSEPMVIATPAANYKIESMIVDGFAVVTDSEPMEEDEYVSTYADGRIVAYQAYIEGSLKASVKFVRDGSAIESIGADEAGDAEFFNLQGIRVARENLVPGIYIMRNAEGARKVSVK